ncbi:TrkH family potassium uptake protein [Allobaculum sp. JKK-2023]|uniref:TrkH family potassium uptake protein n=1 Tax=Allobaculum sp. JKK-2023 TaxID=3108943 RepID=UPI002B059CDD|nr:potassium transporter TrkG [Allobaculum sp. JKK-2023]
MVIRRIQKWFFKLTPARLLVLGFLSVILSGAFLLWLPISRYAGVPLSFLDALFEACSAVCVTGLTVVVPGQTFNLFGRTVLAILIQIGGMGIVLAGMTFMLVSGGKISFKTRALFVQAQNLSGYTGLIHIAKCILYLTFGIEALGALLMWPVLMMHFSPLQALGHAVFLSISAFNNAGFDLFAGGDSLIPYANNLPLILVVSALVIIGGFGFIAMVDLVRNHFRWSRLMLTTKIAAFMTILLLAGGTILFKILTPQTWLEAWFQSVITRTAGFASYPLSNFSTGALLVFIVLMFIGASPNSTGGGIKTTTAFAISLKAFSSSAGHDEDSVFYRRIPDICFTKASTVLYFGLLAVLLGTILICAFDPQFTLAEVLVEVTSALATVGSSIGITAQLSEASELVIIALMFMGRLGTVTIANLLITGKEPKAHYSEESILIG